MMVGKCWPKTLWGCGMVMPKGLSLAYESIKMFGPRKIFVLIRMPRDCTEPHAPSLNSPLSWWGIPYNQHGRQQQPQNAQEHH